MASLTIRVLGFELLHITSGEDEVVYTEGTELAGGTTSAYPIGFSPSPGDQRWEPGVECE